MTVEANLTKGNLLGSGVTRTDTFPYEAVVSGLEVEMAETREVSSGKMVGPLAGKWGAQGVLDAANRLLRGRQSKEPEVEHGVMDVLKAARCSYDIRVSNEGGEMDLILRAERVVIEVKRPGRADDPFAAGTGSRGNESAYDQLERCVQGEREDEMRRLSFGDQSPWRGIVCNGTWWHAWEWPIDPGSHDKPRHLGSNLFGSGQSVELVTWLGRVCEHGSGLEALPEDFHELLFAPHLSTLQSLHTELVSGYDREAKRIRDTQYELWRDLLAGADMTPPDAEANQLFLSHTFLVIAARVVADALGGSSAPKESLASDGFVSWVSHTPGGDEWVERMRKTAALYDWRGRSRDVFREMYETVIRPDLRKYFGEYYTPDWLAAMIVEEVCDEEWCDMAINKALASPDNEVLEGIGVLDPACGSGSFLFHAAKRLLSRPLLADNPITDVVKANAVAKLVMGIDIHPVAVEIARATLLRALPDLPSRGIDALRVWQGDSLGQSTSQFHVSDDNYLLVETPGGGSLVIPMEFIWREPTMSNLKTLIAYASHREGALPEYLIDGLGDQAKAEMRRAHQSLRDIIAKEGNGVWAWFIANQVAPHRLAQTKVDRIVANPPWVIMSKIQEKERKENLESLIEGEGLWPSGIGKRGSFDIAALFLRLCPRRYFYKGRGKSGWITGAGALSGGNWDAYNATRPPTLTVDLSRVKKAPFTGAKSCVHYFGNGVKAGTKEMRALRRKPIKQRDDWPLAKSKTEIYDVVYPPVAPSKYLLHTISRSGETKTSSLFTAGGRLLPLNLVVCDTTTPKGAGMIEFTTRLFPRANKKWKTLQAQTGEVPKAWVRDVVLQGELLPYVLNAPTKCVIPSDASGGILTDDKALENPYWERVDHLYWKNRGQGTGTPDTLLGYLKINNNLKRLVGATLGSGDSMVIYNASGTHLRASRSLSKILVNDSLYWFVCPEQEAAYLTVLLNASALADRFRATRHSDRDFHTYLWSEVPVPRYDGDNPHHHELASLCHKAEEVAAGLLPAVAADEQDDASRKIRRALVEAGIEAEITAAVKHVIPVEHLI